MSELPQSVRQKLAQGQNPAEAHPDADVLTAFAENTLTSREREGVLQHLGSCRRCRDLVHLGAAPVDAGLAPLPGSRSWLRWPMMRWAAAAACLVVVAGAVLLVYLPKRATEEFSRARVETSTIPPATSAPKVQPQSSDLHGIEQRQGGASNPGPSSRPASDFELDKNAAATVRQKDEKSLSSNARADRDVQTAPVQDEGKTAKVATGNMVARKFQDKFANQNSPGGPSPLANQQVSQNTTDQLKQQNEAYAYKAAPAAPPPAPLAGAAPAPARAAKAPTEERTADMAASSTVPMKKEMAKAAEPAVANAESQVQTTGEAANQAASANAVEVTTAKTKGLAGAKMAQMQRLTAAIWRISQKSRLQFSNDGGQSWRNASLDANVVVRAVSALGADVWAGGNGGMLVHSVDSGASWQRVVPSVDGRQLSGDIVSVEFTDAAHGNVATSSGEVWTSDDGGRTWSVR